jgi:hypothetical protein
VQVKKKVRILPFFFLDEKESKNQGSEFLFVRESLVLKYLRLVANNFNSFLKLKFFKNVLAEILKIKSFSSVAKTKKFKAEDCSQIFTK